MTLGRDSTWSLFIQNHGLEINGPVLNLMKYLYYRGQLYGYTSVNCTFDIYIFIWVSVLILINIHIRALCGRRLIPTH